MTAAQTIKRFLNGKQVPREILEGAALELFANMELCLEDELGRETVTGADLLTDNGFDGCIIEPLFLIHQGAQRVMLGGGAAPAFFLSHKVSA